MGFIHLMNEKERNEKDASKNVSKPYKKVTDLVAHR